MPIYCKVCDRELPPGRWVDLEAAGWSLTDQCDGLICPACVERRKRRLALVS